MSTSHYTLPDGRTLAYESYGDPQGFPVIGLHGLPGSRVWSVEEDKVAQKLGILLLTPDRPGYGQSTLRSGSTFLAVADDIAAWTQGLGLSEFSIFGVSGGGVFAAAFASKYPHHLHKLGLVSTVNQFVKGRPPQGMAYANRLTFKLARKAPWLLRIILAQQARLIRKNPQAFLQASLRPQPHLCPSDQAVMALEENAQIMLAHLQAAYRQGVKAAVAEARLCTRPWGFEPQCIEVPTEMWHGEADTLSPVGPIKDLAAAMPKAKSHFLPEKGHFLTDEEEIWEQILVSLKK
ncbi:MAG: alpha/beta hydrolase [Bacteroidota bacterium]